MVYLAATALSLLFVQLSIKLKYSKSNIINTKSNLFFLILSILPLSLISAIRYNVGSDYVSYCMIYNNFTLNSRLEIGFRYFVYILRKVSTNPQFFFAVTSFFIIGAYYYLFYRESQNVAFSVLLFVISLEYFACMNGVRQYIAIAITMFAVSFLKSRSFIKYFLIVLLAACFHISALILIPFYFIVNIKIKITQAFVVFAGVILFGQSITSIVELFGGNHYEKYFLENSYFSRSNPDLALLFVSFSLFLICAFIFIAKKNISNDNLKILYWSLVCNVIFSLITFYSPSNFSRIAWYFNVFIIIYMPSLSLQIGKKNNRLIFNLILVIGYFVLFILLTQVIGNRHNAFPYLHI